VLGGGAGGGVGTAGAGAGTSGLTIDPKTGQYIDPKTGLPVWQTGNTTDGSGGSTTTTPFDPSSLGGVSATGAWDPSTAPGATAAQNTEAFLQGLGITQQDLQGVTASTAPGSTPEQHVMAFLQQMGIDPADLGLGAQPTDSVTAPNYDPTETAQQADLTEATQVLQEHSNPTLNREGWNLPQFEALLAAGFDPTTASSAQEAKAMNWIGDSTTALPGPGYAVDPATGQFTMQPTAAQTLTGGYSVGNYTDPLSGLTWTPDPNTGVIVPVLTDPGPDTTVDYSGDTSGEDYDEEVTSVDEGD
jgi:hypothetical protein